MKAKEIQARGHRLLLGPESGQWAECQRCFFVRYKVFLWGAKHADDFEEEFESHKCQEN